MDTKTVLFQISKWDPDNEGERIRLFKTFTVPVTKVFNKNDIVFFVFDKEPHKKNSARVIEVSHYIGGDTAHSDIVELGYRWDHPIPVEDLRADGWAEVKI